MQTIEITNPLREGLPRARMAEPCAMVIFGATGDLTRRKLVPALYNLALTGHLPAEFAVVGFARSRREEEAFREELRSGVEEFSRTGLDTETWEAFARGSPTCAPTTRAPEGYRRAEAAAGGARPGARDGRQPALLPGDAPDVTADDRHPARRGGPGLSAR